MFSDQTIDPFAAQLGAGERILWRQTAPPLRLAASKLPGLGFALVWAGFSWTWTFLALSAIGPALFDGGANALDGAAILFVLIGGLFSIVGIVMMWGVIADLIDSWRTHYALTNKRLLIISGGRVTTYQGDAFDQIERTRDGTIRFAWGPTSRRHAGFTATLIGVADPVHLEDLIRTHFGPPRVASTPA